MTTKLPPQLKRTKVETDLFFGWFFDEVYRTNVFCLWPTAGKKVDSAVLNGFVKDVFNVNYEAPDPFSGLCCAITGPTIRAYLIVLAEPWIGTNSEICTLAHESWHCADMVMASCGVEHSDSSNNEAFAYFGESILRRCLKIVTGKD